MKTTALFAVLAVSAASANAAAVADAEAQFCNWIGQSCWKVRRTAEAFAEAIASSGLPADGGEHALLSRSSHAPGGLSHNAMRSLDGLATIVASTQNDPRSFYSDLLIAKHFPGPTPAEAGAEKREADANPEAEAQFCNWIGQSCWKVRRAAEAVVNTIDGFGTGALEAREAEPEAQFCDWIGQSCWKRSAEPEAQFCNWIGQSCWKRSDNVEARCNAPGSSCAVAARDLHAMYSAARSVLDNLPAQ